jgi:hypothetical protein
MDDDFAITLELFLFASNIKKQICGILDSFLSFLGKYEERKVHNMLSLMLDSQFKNPCLLSSFVGCKQGISIRKDCDLKSLQPMFLKCYHHLHHMKNYDVECIKHKSYEDNIFDIFEMIVSTSEPMTKLVNREFLIFRRFQMDSNAIYNGGTNMGLCSPLLVFLLDKH